MGDDSNFIARFISLHVIILGHELFEILYNEHFGPGLELSLLNQSHFRSNEYITEFDYRGLIKLTKELMPQMKNDPISNLDGYWPTQQNYVLNSQYTLFYIVRKISQ